MMRGNPSLHAMADHVFEIVVAGDEIRIDHIKNRNGMVFSNDDPRLEGVRDAVRFFIAGDAV